jgi:nucleoid-associated protein YgaU
MRVRRLSRSFLSIRGLLLVGVALFASLALLACSAPGLGDDEDPASASPRADQATPTSAKPMTIVTPTPFVATTPQPGETPSVPAENPATYVVQENDTLYAIALKFNVDLNVLIELNGLSDPNDIGVGQELQIPPKPQ